MSTQYQQISLADLAIINKTLKSITSDISTVSSDMKFVHSELGTVNFKQDKLESELLKFAETFNAFVEADLKQKALQLAETRQGNLKQDLQIKFGYYAEVRRMAAGILQGVDAGIISEDTLKYSTEEVMLKAPGYWLAPALVALAAWIRNDKSTHEKALKEALKRDDYKTTLFFMLVMRRLSRNEASFKWLQRYFMHQNPHNLDREFIIILEAVTTGVFPPAARQLMMTNVKNWLDQLTQGDTFIDKQKTQWVSFFKAMGPLPDKKYILLSKFATNWDALENSLTEAKTQKVINKHFEGVISSSSDFSKGIKVLLDEILSMSVTNFDEEELPLQEEVRLNQLIIELEGDKLAAQAIMNAESHIFEEQVDFLQLLTNAAFNPELSGATKVTQALAVSISQPWIVEAHNTFTAQSRNKIPQTLELDINGFEISTKDGSDEQDLVEKQALFYKDALNAKLDELAFPFFRICVGAIICLIGIYLLIKETPDLGMLLLGGGGMILWHLITNHKKAKAIIVANFAERERKAKAVLRGCIAEAVDYRQEHTMEDSNAEKVTELLSSITPEDFASVSQETARSII